MTYEAFVELVERLWEEIPEDFKRGLQGVHVFPQAKPEPGLEGVWRLGEYLDPGPPSASGGLRAWGGTSPSTTALSRRWRGRGWTGRPRCGKPSSTSSGTTWSPWRGGTTLPGRTSGAWTPFAGAGPLGKGRGFFRKGPALGEAPGEGVVVGHLGLPLLPAEEDHLAPDAGGEVHQALVQVLEEDPQGGQVAGVGLEAPRRKRASSSRALRSSPRASASRLWASWSSFRFWRISFRTRRISGRRASASSLVKIRANIPTPILAETVRKI